MNSEAEGSVTVGFAIDNELVGLVKERWVTIGRGKGQEHPLVGFHWASMKVVVIFDQASHRDRGVGPQEFLEGEQHHLGFVNNSLQIIRVVGEMPQGRADRTPGRIDPRDQEQHDRAAHVFNAEFVAVDLHVE